MKNEAVAAAQERPRDKEERKRVLNLRLSRIANASVLHGKTAKCTSLIRLK